MTQLTAAHVKALHDNLGDDLTAFFVNEFGVESDGTPESDEAETKL
jgi:hypothetical protein